MHMSRLILCVCIRGCLLDDTGPQFFPKWPQFGKFDMLTVRITKYLLSLQIRKTEAALEYAIVYLVDTSYYFSILD